VETCRRQSRNSYDWRATAIEAHLAGKPTPSLLVGA
jgi:hypothetical protein